MGMAKEQCVLIGICLWGHKQRVAFGNLLLPVLFYDASNYLVHQAGAFLQHVYDYFGFRVEVVIF